MNGWQVLAVVGVLAIMIVIVKALVLKGECKRSCSPDPVVASYTHGGFFETYAVCRRPDGAIRAERCSP